MQDEFSNADPAVVPDRTKIQDLERSRETGIERSVEPARPLMGIEPTLSRHYDIVLDFDGPRITAEKFKAAVDAFFDLITRVAQEFAQQRKAVDWIISVKSGSNLVIAHPEPREMDPLQLSAAINYLAEGLQALDTGEDIARPAFFDDRALRSAQQLSRTLGDGIDYINLHVGNLTQPISPRMAVSVSALLEASYSSVGTVEGKLQVISERNGLRFYVYNSVDDRKVECYFERERLAEIIDAFSRRVSVRGKIRYRKDGTPLSVDVDSFRVLGRADDLPSFNDIIGLFGEE